MRIQWHAGSNPVSPTVKSLMRDGLGVFRGRLSLLPGRLMQQPIQQRGSPRCRSHGGGDRTQPLSGRAHPPGWPRSSTFRSMHGECLRQPLTVRGEYEAELRDWPRSGSSFGPRWSRHLAVASPKSAPVRRNREEVGPDAPARTPFRGKRLPLRRPGVLPCGNPILTNGGLS